MGLFFPDQLLQRSVSGFAFRAELDAHVRLGNAARAPAKLVILDMPLMPGPERTRLLLSRAPCAEELGRGYLCGSQRQRFAAGPSDPKDTFLLGLFMAGHGSIAEPTDRQIPHTN